MRIAILSGPFFHDCKEVTRTIDGQQIKGTDRIIFGGAERLLIDLCELLQSMNIAVTVYQPFNGINKPFSKQYKGITFVMIPNNGGWEYHTCTDLNWQFNELSAMDDMRIFFATYLCWPHCPPNSIAISHGIYWDNIQGNSIINNFNDEQRKEFFKRQLYGFTAPDVVISVDSNVRKVIQAMLPGAEDKIQIIYNYVDSQKFVPVPKTWEGINILFPRRLTALRGSTEITKAFINYPQYNFTLVGQAHDENAAQAFANGHKNRGNVTFTHKETDEMPDMYKNIDISVIPTIASEGLSLSLLESMSCGLPVITTPVGGLGDAVIHKHNAYIYDPNHEDLGAIIDYYAKDEETRIKWGKRNREIAVECFDIEIWKSHWRNLIQQFGG
jgi:glycosyltransferase involved in cell wall biosynthesis